VSSKKKQWTLLLAAGGVAGIGAGVLVYFQHRGIEEARRRADELHVKINADAKLLQRLPDLEDEVIIQRDTDALIQEILPNEQDITDFSRTLQLFAEQSGVVMESVKKKPLDKREADSEFQKVGYQISLSADAFQLLAYLDLVERYRRFMSVTGFQLTATKSRRKDAGDAGPTRHQVQIDVETYVYAPKGGAKSVDIDRHERKRDELVARIAERRSEIQPKPYDYRGPRGRRDPWIDPRVPKESENDSVLPIEEQLALVDDLVVRTQHVLGLWSTARTAESPIAQLKAQAELDKALAPLELEVRRIDAEGQIAFSMAEKRFRVEVVDKLAALRGELAAAGDGGPSAAALRDACDEMRAHIDAQEFDLALAVYQTMEPKLSLAERDPTRRSLIQELRELEHSTRTVLEFERLKLAITGVVIMEGRTPVAVINGRAVEVGDMLEDGTVVHAIRRDAVDFLYQGLVLSRRVES
jgi:Tfp pilus assembly protein PilO